MMTQLNRAYDSVDVGGLRLKNRFIKTATYEGMTPKGIPSRQLTAFHQKIAAGGVALTTVAYGAVNPDGRTHMEQLIIDKNSEDGLRQLAKGVHDAGGKVSIQLTHCGFFTRNRHLSTGRPLAPSRTFNAYGFMSGIPFSRAITHAEMRSVINDFASAARMCVEAGFDAVEIHMGHGYLLSQFLSPSINRRKDLYGGHSENRLRFPSEVLRAVRKQVSRDTGIFVKINLSDGFKGGVTPDDTIEYIRHLGDAGADAFILSGSYTSKTPFYLMRGAVPLSGMVSVEKNILQKLAIRAFGPLIMKTYPFEEHYFLNMARKVRRNTDALLVYQGGVVSSDGINEIVSEGFDMIGLGRALIHDPSFVQAVKMNPSHRSPCDHCNECMVEMDRAGVKCILNTNDMKPRPNPG